MSNFFETNRTNLENFRRVSGTVGARADYVQGGGGNTSVRLDGGLMAIKASGYCLKDIDVDKAYAVSDYVSLRDFYNNTDPERESDVEKTGSERAKASIQTIEGLAALRPSVEAGFHSLLGSLVWPTATASTPIWPPVLRTAARSSPGRWRVRTTPGASCPTPIPARA